MFIQKYIEFITERKSYFDLIQDHKLIKKMLLEFGLESSMDNFTISEQKKDSIRYKIDNKHALIFTTEFSEAETAHRLSKKNVTKYIINTFDVRVLKGDFLDKSKKTLYAILCDYYVNLNADDSNLINKLSSTLDLYSLLEEDYMDEYMVEHVIENYDDTMIERIAFIITELKNILTECDKLKLSYPVLNGANFGWNNNNDLMLINIGFQNYNNVGAAKPMKIVNILENIQHTSLKGKNLLFHSTTFSRAYDIFAEDEIYEATKQKIKTKFGDHIKHYDKNSEQYVGVSFSRNPSFIHSDIQFIFDYDQIKQVYGKKLVPHDFYNYTKNKSNPERKHTYESEEYLIGNLKPMHKYLKAIRFTERINTLAELKENDENLYNFLKGYVDLYTAYDKDFNEIQM